MHDGVALEYAGPAPIILRGSTTQRSYTFRRGRVTLVDPRDADALVRTRLLRRAK